MILLIDNKQNMIRFCENDPDIYGFDPVYPNWKNYVKFLSDTDHMVVLSGDEAEEWLDAENIYYVHVEDKDDETYTQFKRRVDKLIEENREYIDSSTSYGKLIFSLDKSGNPGTRDTENSLEVWRLNRDGRYHITLDLPDNVSGYTYGRIIGGMLDKYNKMLRIVEDEEKVKVDELTSGSFNLFTADTLTGVALRLSILKDMFAKDFIEVENEYPYDEEEDEYVDDEDEDEDDEWNEEEEEIKDCMKQEFDHSPCSCRVRGLIAKFGSSDDKANKEVLFERDNDEYFINGEKVDKDYWQHKLTEEFKCSKEEKECEDESEEENSEKSNLIEDIAEAIADYLISIGRIALD